MLPETHLDQLSSLYSNDRYTVVVYNTPLQQRLSAVVYVDESKESNDEDIISHLDKVYINLNLQPYESISVIRIIRNKKPPLNVFDEVDYRYIRSVEVHK